MNRVYDSVDSYIDPVWVGGTNIVAKLLVAICRLICVNTSVALAQQGKKGDTDKFGILNGKKRRFVGRIRESVGRCLKHKGVGKRQQVYNTKACRVVGGLTGVPSQMSWSTAPSARMQHC